MLTAALTFFSAETENPAQCLSEPGKVYLQTDDDRWKTLRRIEVRFEPCVLAPFECSVLSMKFRLEKLLEQLDRTNQGIPEIVSLVARPPNLARIIE